MLDVNRIRSHFPALSRTFNGKPLVYFDGPGGTQVPTECIDAMVDYYHRCNANTHGNFITSQESDAVIAAAHEYMADFVNAKSANEIVFGQNMTSLTFAISRSIGQTLQPGDEIILTLLDHAGNFSPWHLMAQDRGVKVNVIDINPEDCTLKMDDFEKYLSNRTKLIAVGCCSNAVGTFNPVKQIVGMAKAVGAMTYLDAVAFAPHAPIDVQDLDCDFLACSAYKFLARIRASCMANTIFWIVCLPTKFAQPMPARRTSSRPARRALSPRPGRWARWITSRGLARPTRQPKRQPANSALSGRPPCTLA